MNIQECITNFNQIIIREVHIDYFTEKNESKIYENLLFKKHIIEKE